MITFKKWDDILQQPAISANHHYAALIQHFAKGLAYANTSQVDKAKTSLDSVEFLLKEKDIAVVLTPFNAPLSGGKIAKYLLQGTIADKENRRNEAILHFKKAVDIEDVMIYNEPRDWLIPARHFLGSALLAVKDYKEAEKIFRENLKSEPNNHTATTGLKKAVQRSQKK